MVISFIILLTLFLFASDFQKCCKDAGLSMVIKCRGENDALKTCMTKYFQDESFKKECEEIYLKDRAEFRRTGVGRQHLKRM